MRIAVWHDLPAGGARRALQELTRRLAKRHSIQPYLIDPPPADHSLIGGNGDAAIPIPYSPRKPRRFSLYWNDWITYRDTKDLSRVESLVAESMDSEQYDAVLVSTLRGALAPDITRHLSTPSVYYCHEPPRRFYEPWCRPQASPLSPYERLRLYAHYPTHSLLNAYHKQEDVQRVQAADVVLTNSKYSKDRIQRIYSRSAEVSYLGVDETRFHPAPSIRQGNLVLSVGRFEAHKGFEFLIEALSVIPHPDRPTLALVGAGGHPRMQDHLSSRARELEVGVEFHREINDEQLTNLYQSAAMFLFSPYFEPFGLVVLEAMACGLPVVGVDEGGLSESVQHGVSGYLTDRDPKLFADAIRELIHSPGTRERFGRAGREAIEQSWTWDQAAERLERHLQEVVG